MTKARIIRYYQVIDEKGNLLINTHFLRDAKNFKEEYEDTNE